jgi:hypothetical protein
MSSQLICCPAILVGVLQVFHSSHKSYSCMVLICWFSPTKNNVIVLNSWPSYDLEF